MSKNAPLRRGDLYSRFQNVGYPRIVYVQTVCRCCHLRCGACVAGLGPGFVDEEGRVWANDPFLGTKVRVAAALPMNPQ